MDIQENEELLRMYRLANDFLHPFLNTEETPEELLEAPDVTPSQVTGDSDKGKVHQMLRGLWLINNLQKELSHAASILVAQAKGAGASWTELGGAVGVSKQAAQQRWGSARTARAAG